MREIKFRAWDEKDGLFSVDKLDTNPKDYVTRVKHPNGLWYWIGEKIHLMQFTGLKDKNGKEIYEGDIILIKPFRKERACMYEVTYTTFAARFDGISMLPGIGDHLSILSNNCEVIGNIYENHFR